MSVSHAPAHSVEPVHTSKEQVQSSHHTREYELVHRKLLFSNTAHANVEIGVQQKYKCIHARCWQHTRETYKVGAIALSESKKTRQRRQETMLT